MIVMSLCNSCLQPFQLLLQPGDMELVKSISENEGRLAPCPRLCGGKINLVGDAVLQQMGTDPRLKEPLHITGKELYQAVNGLGLPDEVSNDPIVLKALLGSCRIDTTDVELCQGKVYLHELRLDNGVTIHLTAGPRGAQVLKITKKMVHGT